jgi:transposase InsO family protein
MLDDTTARKVQKKLIGRMLAKSEVAGLLGRPASRANETWAMDFVHDQLATGRKLRVLTVLDIFSRFSRWC